MQLKIYKNYEALSIAVADEIINAVKRNPKATLCLASGDTPRRAYSLVVQKCREDKVDLKNSTFVALDEWMGIPPNNEGSCQYFLRQTMFTPLNIPENNLHFFNALSVDPQAECDKMNAVIRDQGGIDLMVIGIGMNGHIGFNEPGESLQQYAHVVELDETSKIVGQKYFKESTTLTTGITLGLSHMLESRQAILIANGLKKSGIIRKMIEEEVGPHLPASAIRRHANGFVMLDEDAATLLG
jgi:glucosamine-6-phosphate isomerase